MAIAIMLNVAFLEPPAGFVAAALEAGVADLSVVAIVCIFKKINKQLNS
jgi:hypothetical protein